MTPGENDAIMGNIKTVCERRQLVAPEQERSCTYQFMAEKLNVYSNLFNSLDATFGFLRIIHPNEEELMMTKSAVRITREIWIRLGFSITPKAHILFYHVCDQQRLYEGLLDKCEDWIEQSHQTGI